MEKMAATSVEDFLGDGPLYGLEPMFAAKGFDDVAKLMMMSSEQMDEMELTQDQKDALEIRSYLHGRFLMGYAERLEASRKSLAKLLTLSTSTLSTQYGMKRGDVTRFIIRASACTGSMRSACVLPPREMIMSSAGKSSLRESRKFRNMSSLRGSSKYEVSIEKSMADFAIDDDYVFKGIVAAEPTEPRLCGCLQPPLVDGIAPYSSIENISVQRLTPEYKPGMESLVKMEAPPMKASDLWHDKPAILLCIRRPGCIMCRAEAHQIYARKRFFDELGFQLIAVLHEQIESEIKDFWPAYWGGVVILDKSMSFFKALGGGKLLKDNFFTGFLLNPRAIVNFRRAKATGMEHNFRGEGNVKGGLFIIGRRKCGIAYQFIERNFGDWAPVAEVIDICTRLQNGQALGSLPEAQ